MRNHRLAPVLVFAALMLGGCGSDAAPLAETGPEAPSAATILRTVYESCVDIGPTPDGLLKYARSKQIDLPEIMSLNGITIADGDQTLTVRGESAITGKTQWERDLAKQINDAMSVSAKPADIRCVLDGVEAPQRVVHAINSTRALDGRQTDAWGQLAAQWSYHPDKGLDLMVYVAD